ncbi:hypothetical protein ABZ070_27735 [Streptomyces sp. NPDC006283]|uniref:hypothetical protein n=1 Tax=Streptomyces sp. NPDC006283 TaxID=3156741 RepID=UPI0033BCBCC3
MLIGRDRRHRLLVTASLLLGLLGALLGCLGATATAAETGAASRAAAGTAASPWGTAAVVTTADAAQPQGCGRDTNGDDSGAHPAPPPRNGSSYELLPPALQQGHGSTGAAAFDQAAPAPLPIPPPLAPPSAVDLSVLRV